MVTTAQQRKNDVLASNLLFGSLVLTIVIALIRHRIMPANNHASDTLFAGGLAVIALLYGLLFYAIRQGHYWAKVVLLLLFILAFTGSIIMHKTAISAGNTDALNVADNVIHYGFHIWALFLLFIKSRPLKA